MDWDYFWDHTFVGALVFQFVFLIALFGVARVIAWLVWKLLPAGKLKSALFRRSPD